MIRNFTSVTKHYDKSNTFNAYIIVENTVNEEFTIYWLFSAASAFTSGGVSNTWIDYSASRFANSDLAGLGGSTSDEVYMTGAQLEVGTAASDFEFLPHDVNLKRCQRYYYLHTGIASNIPIGIGYYYSGTYLCAFVYFPTTMRNSPSTVSPNSSNYFKIDRNGGSNQFDTFSAEITSPNAVQIYNGSASGSTGDVGSVRTNNSSSYLAFESEL